jgi:hypothetical protein
MARWFGVPFTENTGHTIANIVEWLALVGALLGLDLWLGRRLAQRSGAPEPVAERLPAAAPGSLGRAGVVLWLCAPPLLALSLYRPAGGGTERASRLPADVAAYALVERNADEQARFARDLPRYRELLGTDDFVWRRYRDLDGESLWLTALFHDANWKSVHPPRICIEGSNMTVESDDLVPAPWLDGETAVGRIVARRRGDGARYVTLSVFGTAGWLSGDYWDFTWHHLPLAVLRQNKSGFLLRVESLVRPGERPADAEARCARFLAELVPMARELLR